MRVLFLSKASIVGQYQTKLAALAAKPGLELVGVVPPSWQDERGTLNLERKHVSGYEMLVAPIRFNGHFHLHYYPTLPDILARFQPDIVHLDEEPYNFATFHAVRAVKRADAKTRVLFFSWQNLFRHYPPPFAWMEQYVYVHADAAIAGNRDAQAILRQKGFQKQICIIPQFGVPDSFAHAATLQTHRPLTIGYAGRLVREKGVEVLLEALARVPGDWQLKIVGSGPLYEPLVQLARKLGLSDQVHFTPWVASDEMPRFYSSLDVLVVPSLTLANWKEQFGRVIMEAMASGVPVIGSDSGEIPNVLGDAGVIVPEGNVNALTDALAELLTNESKRQVLGARGRTRALTVYSQQRVVDDTFALYQQLLKPDRSGDGHVP